MIGDYQGENYSGNNGQPPAKPTKPIRRITDPDEVRKYLRVRVPGMEEEIIEMVAKSGALLEGHFVITDDN